MNQAYNNEVPSTVEISKVSYKYIRGSVNTEVAVSSKCSENK